MLIYTELVCPSASVSVTALYPSSPRNQPQLKKKKEKDLKNNMCCVSMYYVEIYVYIYIYIYKL